jgi:hypothetical protein
LIACRNPLLAEERARKRQQLLADTEKRLDEIVAATRRKNRPLTGFALSHHFTEYTHLLSSSSLAD